MRPCGFLRQNHPNGNALSGLERGYGRADRRLFVFLPVRPRHLLQLRHWRQDRVGFGCRCRPSHALQHRQGAHVALRDTRSGRPHPKHGLVCIEKFGLTVSQEPTQSWLTIGRKNMSPRQGLSRFGDRTLLSFVRAFSCPHYARDLCTFQAIVFIG